MGQHHQDTAIIFYSSQPHAHYYECTVILWMRTTLSTTTCVSEGGAIPPRIVPRAQAQCLSYALYPLHSAQALEEQEQFKSWGGGPRGLDRPVGSKIATRS